MLPTKTKLLYLKSTSEEIESKPQDKKDVIQSEAIVAKSWTWGVCSKPDNRTTRNADKESSSIRTPCGPVFDASQPTASGTSLNDILAKRKNNMNKLIEIVIH